MAGDRSGERFELLLLRREPHGIVRRGVAPVQADLPAGLEQRLDEARPQPAVRLGGGAVVRVVMARDHVEGRAGRAAAAFLRQDLLEAPVGIRAAQAVQRHGREPCRLTHRGAEPRVANVLLQPCGRTAQADARPAPRRVDVVRERDREARSIVSRGDAELSPQTLERRIERIQAGPLGAKAAVLVAGTVSLLDAGKMEEAVGEVVADRSLAAIDLLPGSGVVRQVVAEAELGRADRVEHPARTSFDDGRNHRSALRTTRARCTAPGFGSSRAKTPST